MTQISVGGGEVTGSQIRAAMLGSPVDGLEVVRQACRVTSTDSDELVLLCVRGSSWWVARRLGEQLAVWAFAGDDEAWDGFDRLKDGEGWREASGAADPAAPLAS
ncbi:hypothetical protein [Jatrophihabitans endophyticus]|uniref:hypothetical protein n=1 Tax=Jatrophihabitans endophyticus TaxID=1206085 RepID=UPI0019FDBCC9|nr:hypothetical protein [Jatrophihabitans endophyticus]MBE7186980.1 hypothetical protein [Jatrophihabitans endophyticus]